MSPFYHACFFEIQVKIAGGFKGYSIPGTSAGDEIDILKPKRIKL
jgi:hypothetical protein